ncbi:AAA family ATPase [Kutzneria sp. CA-103260]|uniref:AAA family ATPase n=1 Tax=Kutzneria sp. CA-103260 TaxID=2802641 RepID=UPI001BA69FF9|nr:AAA family ATPase [Kutzneria sp. CA-103260]QUQ67250.1 Adenylyl-sulfate kinase [Kutzneria sp. CA-103260]
MGESVPVLWLCGPSGVGKTAVAWEIHQRIADSAYVDIDQLGMCYPATDSDPHRHALKARNLDAVVAGHREAGASCVVVSGVVDPRTGPPVSPVLTVVRLRADRDELRRRFEEREGAAPTAEVLREADALDASDFAALCVDTTGVAVTAVADEVLKATGWPRRPRVLWLCGVTGVGKSAVGFAVYQRLLSAGSTAAYVDLDQIGDDHRMRSRTLATLWRNFRAVGAQAMVVVGPIHDASTLSLYAGELGPVDLRLVRLHAGVDELTARILRRGRGESWAQPGDPLLGRPESELRAVAAAAAVESKTLTLGQRIDTDGRTVDELADALVAAP